MTPEQAAVSANILKAQSVIPIHYGSFHKPPIYIETPDATDRLRKNLNEMQIHTLIKEPGEWFDLD